MLPQIVYPAVEVKAWVYSKQSGIHFQRALHQGMAKSPWLEAGGLGTI